MITRRALRPLGAFAKEPWLCPSCTRASITQSTSRRTLASARDLPPSHRPRYVPPPLTNEAVFREQGVPGLFSAEGFALGYVQHQNLMLTKLRELLAGDPDEDSGMKPLILEYARNPQSAALFNHASMAFNTHFFYSGLSTSPVTLGNISGGLEDVLTREFGSIDTLRATFLDTAAAMFAPGFVWLVWARDLPGPSISSRRGGWRILSTYAAGTPFPEAGYRQQPLDANTNSPGSYNSTLSSIPANNAGAFGRHSEAGRRAAKLPPGGTSVMPVLCVSTWEHKWLYDFGLGGKRKFLSDWWDAIDWKAVDNRTPQDAKQQNLRFQ